MPARAGPAGPRIEGGQAAAELQSGPPPPARRRPRFGLPAWPGRPSWAGQLGQRVPEPGLTAGAHRAARLRRPRFPGRTLIRLLHQPAIDFLDGHLAAIAVRQAVRRTHADLGTILLKDVSGRLQVAAATGHAETAAEPPVDGLPPEDLPATMSATTSILAVNGPGDPGQRPVELFVIVPLVHDDHTFGLIAVARRGDQGGGQVPASPGTSSRS